MAYSEGCVSTYTYTVDVILASILIVKPEILLLIIIIAMLI